MALLPKLTVDFRNVVKPSTTPLTGPGASAAPRLQTPARKAVNNTSYFSPELARIQAQSKPASQVQTPPGQAYLEFQLARARTPEAQRGRQLYEAAKARQQINPYEEMLRAQQEAMRKAQAEEEARRRKAQAEQQARLKAARKELERMTQNELDLALQAIAAQRKVGERQIDSQLAELPGLEQQAIRGVQNARSEQVRAVISDAISRGMVGSGARISGGQEALKAEAEAKSRVSTDIQKQKNQLIQARQDLLTELQNLEQQRRLERDRRLREFDLSALSQMGIYS